MSEPEPRLSYKFQRLREQLRAAIDSGELSGKLPGERQLAKRFGVNAKTLGKALTDLAAEGVLERTIGRGSFVRGAADDAAGPAPAAGERVLCLAPGVDDPTAAALRRLEPALRVADDLSLLRPSFLRDFNVVIDLRGDLPDAVLRDFALRNFHVVHADSTPQLYSADAVLIDRAFAAAVQVRDLIRAGYAAIRVVEPDDATSDRAATSDRITTSDRATPSTDSAAAPSEVLDAARAAVRRLGVDASVERRSLDEVGTPSDARSDVAYLCGSAAVARAVRDRLARAGVRVPHDAGVVALGLDDDDDASDDSAAPSRGGSSGYLVTRGQLAETILDVVRAPVPRRPAPLWLVGRFIDRGTARVPGATLATLDGVAVRDRADARSPAAPHGDPAR